MTGTRSRSRVYRDALAIGSQREVVRMPVGWLEPPEQAVPGTLRAGLGAFGNPRGWHELFALPYAIISIRFAELQHVGSGQPQPKGTEMGPAGRCPPEVCEKPRRSRSSTWSNAGREMIPTGRKASPSHSPRRNAH